MLNRFSRNSGFPGHREEAPVSTFFFGKAATVAVVFLILLWLYAPSLDFHFWLDDYTILDGCRFTSAGDLIRSFHPAQPGWGAGEFTPQYRPLSRKLYFGVVRLIAGPNPLYYHCISLGLLGLISLIIYLIATRLSDDKLVGFFGAVLFAIHTSHGITQVWISLTQDLIVVFLMTAAFYTYLLSIRTESIKYRVSSAALFLLALLSKEQAVIFPGLILLVELLYSTPRSLAEVKRLVVRLVPFILITFVFLVFRVVYFDLPRSGPYEVTIGLFVLKYFGRYLLIALNGFLAGFLNVPSMDTLFKHGIFQVTNWWLPWIKLSAVTLIVVCLMRLQKWKLHREAIFSIGWFLLAMLPVLFFPNHFYLYYLLPANAGLVFVVAVLLSNTARALYSRSRFLSLTVCMFYFAMMLIHSTSVIRKEQAPLRLVALGMQSVETELRRKLPNPPDNSGFVFSGDYYAGWWRSLSPAIRLIYDNPTLNATAMEDGRIPEKAMKSPGQVYLVHVQDDLVYVTTLK